MDPRLYLRARAIRPPPLRFYRRLRRYGPAGGGGGAFGIPGLSYSRWAALPGFLLPTHLSTYLQHRLDFIVRDMYRRSREIVFERPIVRTGLREPMVEDENQLRSSPRSLPLPRSPSLFLTHS